MALPVVKNALECAEYPTTVAPYLHQLRPLPQTLFESINNAAALKQIYMDTNPLVTALGFSLAIAPIFLIVSEVNKNYSQVDRVWSILPAVYNAHYACYTYLVGLDTTRIGAIAAVSALWSMRLTYNYFRKGGYTIGSEDYRWAIVKEYVGPTVFFAFNISFISLAQSILLWLITTPTYIILLASRLVTVSNEIPSWDARDTIAVSSILLFITLSFVADQQQWNYQNAKSQYRRTAKVPAGYDRDDLDLGFLTKGLFAFSRHPNFAAEQSVWVALYLWSCVVSGSLYNWTGVGAAGYLLLFQASTWLTELLSTQKYPEYKEYQNRVSKFIPLSWKKPALERVPARISNGPAPKGKDAEKARERYNLR